MKSTSRRYPQGQTILARRGSLAPGSQLMRYQQTNQAWVQTAFMS